MDVLLALGTNLGDRVNNLKEVILRLDFLHQKLFSSIYESKALLPENAPESWDKPFLTMAIKGNCFLSAREILKKVKNIEIEIGRDISAPRWSPRIIDIDIILIDKLIYKDKGLQIPHPEFLRRNFVIIPAQEIAGSMTHPEIGIKLKDLKCSLSNIQLTNYQI